MATAYTTDISYMFINCSSVTFQGTKGSPGAYGASGDKGKKGIKGTTSNLNSQQIEM